ncbi:hypothetical protein MKP09_14130 [Niabella ginsengisoli]|uniref:Arylsulfatase n=2 Tax=Niabella ginsengisoli TaxID=522298 RepID=A0ABS9SKX9_9BACT|nr:hypothetical protein [Niabella ginsengisoli]
MGKNKNGRESMLEESYTMSLRKGNWKYIAPQSKPTPAWMVNKRIETGLMPKPQLYNLEADISETNNLSDANPSQLKEMQSILSDILKAPSRPGFKK